MIPAKKVAKLLLAYKERIDATMDRKIPFSPYEVSRLVAVAGLNPTEAKALQHELVDRR